MSPLLFVLSLMIIPLTLVLRKAKGCYEWANRHHTLAHISLIMNDLKLFGKDTRWSRLFTLLAQRY